MAGNESEIKSILSFSSRSQSQEGPPAIRWRNVPLHERCSQEDMLKIKDAFQSAYKNVMLPNEFRLALRNLLNVEYDDEDFNILFMKINTNRNGEITWDELVSHLLLGYFASDPDTVNEALQLPIMGIPQVIRSQHRHPISRICFCPDIDKNRKPDPLQGSYLTVSRDGMINWWSLDMSLMRTAFSSSPSLKVRSTWVTDMVCMPDVNIIVTSSTECDLRFYDCTAKTFTLKIVISSWEYMICSMYYYFSSDIYTNCMLVCGDVGGYVRILTFSPVERGPFRNEAGRALIMIRHKDLQRKPQLIPELHLWEPSRSHTDWVRQVSYYASLHCIVSCATCPDALLLSDSRSSGGGTNNMFHVAKGIQCFAFDEESHVLVTGGPDTAVRVWSPFVPSKPSVVLEGHHAGIISVVLQKKGHMVYSLGRDRTIRVWDVQMQTCLQTYIDVPPVVGERTPISAVYNPATQEFILAAIKIAILILNEQLNPKHTDGYTHARAVSHVLYNPLFKVIITCGLGSFIINWDPLKGTRNVVIKSAHTRLLHGELLPVEITAACFDPGFLLLLTGARNGTLKVWNFNTGVCLRNLRIEHMAEVTNCFWVDGRILAVGWNRHVVEFEDTGTAETGKSWETRHTDDVLAAAIRSPLSLATATYNSEMILWKLETGQPYRQFCCTEPMLRIKMTYSKRGAPPPSAQTTGRPSGRPSLVARAGMQIREGMDLNQALQKARARRLSAVAQPSSARRMRQLAAHCAIFLTTRPVHMQKASLFISLESGQIQGWSDHPAGGFQGSFQAIHTSGDYVSAMATDVNNEFLITGTTVGYLKIWLMTNYLTDEEHVNMPRLRLMFPFLWKDRVEGRAKRSVRDQPKPMLLNSFRAHLRCVTSVAYIDDYQLIVSGSSDYSARVWKLGGQYVGTLGGVGPYSLDIPRDPPDVMKVASSTTLKVWHGGNVSRYVPGQIPVDKLRDITEYELRNKTFGKPPDKPLLGHYFKLPRRAETCPPPVLDDSLPTIPLYTHLRMAATVPIRRPPTPELVRATRLKRTSEKERKTHFESGGPQVQVQVQTKGDRHKDDKHHKGEKTEKKEK